MNDLHPSPLDPDLLALLETERTRPEPSAMDQDRIFGRLATSIVSGAGIDGAGPDGPDGGASPEADTDAGDGGPSDVVPAAARAVKAGANASLLAHPIAMAVTTFVLGGVLGVAVDRAMLPRATSIVYVDRMVAATAEPSPTAPPRESAVATTPAVSASSPTAVPERSSASTASAPASTPSAAASAPHDGNLAGERALLEVAKTALGRRAYADALDALERHAKKYRSAQLAEEREVLAVQALVGLGRTEAARARGDRFKKAFPNSMMLPVVESALR